MALGPACATGPLSQLTRPASPHEEYSERLAEAGLADTALGRDWTMAGEQALRAPVEPALPFNESVYFAPEAARAVGYRLELARGRQLRLDVAPENDAAARLFVDIYRIEPGGAPRRVTSLAPDAATLTYDVDEDAAFVLRLQPELRRGGRYRVVARTLASLPFPVPSLASRPVQSGFGAERDAGRRLHEGIDIFAAAGTPVVAVRPGVARPGTNRLGGNVVWLQEGGSRRSFYYAHLARAAFDAPTRVVAGQVVGYVGNTGNARTTTPHLHFGIYAGRALDPLPFVAADEGVPAPGRPPVPPGELARAARPALEVWTGAPRTSPRAALLPRDTIVLVAGATADAVRVVLPDGVTGYVARETVEDAASPLRRKRLPAGVSVRDAPADRAAVAQILDEPQQVDVLGRFGAYTFVRLNDRRTGWIQ